MRSSERPSKHEAFLALLREGWTSLHLDARRPGVYLPAAPPARAPPGAAVRSRSPDPDSRSGGRRVRGARHAVFLSSPQLTVVPWTSVYVVTCDDGRGVLYHEDGLRTFDDRSPRAQPSGGRSAPGGDEGRIGGRPREPMGRRGGRWRGASSRVRSSRRSGGPRAAQPPPSARPHSRRRAAASPSGAPPQAPAAPPSEVNSEGSLSREAVGFLLGHDESAQELGESACWAVRPRSPAAPPRRRRARRRGCTTADLPRRRRAPSPAGAAAGCRNRRRCP